MRIVRGVALIILLLAIVATLLWARYARRTRVAEPALSGKLFEEVLTSGDRARRFSYYVPARVAAHPALVLVFHASDGNGSTARSAFGFEFDRLADAHGFIVAYPDGYERHWNDCRRAAPYAANRLDIDDVGFARALVDRFATIDRGRVFATGISNGGQMALRLALEAPDLVRAAAPMNTSLPTNQNMDCKPSGKPVSVLFMNGSADPMNPFEGGDTALYGIWGNRGSVLSTADTIAYWTNLAGYRSPPQIDTLPDRDPRDGSTVERSRWHEPGRKEILLYVIRGGGHTVPHPVGRFPRFLGTTNADIAAAQEIWAFFEQAP
jgi:polyhydroxybutyrate depolymerase